MALGLSQADADCAAMVADRNLGEVFLDNASSLAIEEALQSLTHVRLDREKLVSLDLCQYFLALPSLTNLYLQENNLNSLKGLEIAKNLKFLSVAGNCVTKLEGLSSLSQLVVLDISYNEIIEINAEEELPKSLSFLNIVENPCCKRQPNLRDCLKIVLPHLKELDGDSLTDDESTSESESLDTNIETDLNDQTSRSIENDNELTCAEADENQRPPVDQSLISAAREVSAASPMLERIGTPSPFRRLKTLAPVEGRGSQSTDFQSVVGSKDAEDLKECLYEANLEPGSINAPSALCRGTEFALQKLLEMTTGSLDYPAAAILERIEGRVNNFNGQISQEMVDDFFALQSSSRLMTETTKKIENGEVPSLEEALANS